jgi:AhpD family alkylhydroperoxidase
MTNPRAPYDTLAAEGMKALGGVYMYVVRSGLEKSLVDLAYLRASQVNGCAYCIDMHTHDALKDGATVEKLMLVSAWREAGRIFTPRERAALAWSESVTRVADSHIPDADFDAARAVFSDKELADLTLAIGLINTYNRLAIAFRKPPASVAHIPGDA